jgi:hypothetical protein
MKYVRQNKSDLIFSKHMSTGYITFKVFPDKVSAEDFSEVLRHAGIPYEIEEDSLVFDPSYANNPLSRDYIIKIMQSHLKTATKAYTEYFESELDQAPSDHYLFGFTNQELEEILAKPDEWGGFDYLLSIKILKQRGIEFTDDKLETLRSERYKILAKPETEKISNIAAYYLISILIVPVGIIIGWIWGYSKKQLPDGNKIYAYNKVVQRHGRIILFICAVLFVIVVIVRIINA